MVLVSDTLFGQDPWEAVEGDIKKQSTFYLQPVTFQISGMGTSRKSMTVNKQVYRVEMR